MSKTEEQWVPVVGYGGFYEVSNLGRVRTVERQVRNGNGARRVSSRLRKLNPNAKGYSAVGLSRDGIVKTHEVHRLVMETFVGPCPEGLEVCHENGIRSDCRLVNLRYDTRVSNHADKHLHGTASIGERHGRHKLTEKKVERILKLYALGSYTQRQLAAKFKISQSMVSAIVRDKNWTHLDKDKKSLRRASNRSILTEDDVRSIRQERAQNGTTYKRLGEKYGVATTTISGIVNRHRWKHTKD